MRQPRFFPDLASGRQRGLAASALRGLLALAEWPVRGYVHWRNRRYDTGAARVHQVAAPVISVGNLTAGGTGKTPFVAWLAQWLAREGHPVALLSRGYGAARGRPNDEALELALRLPGVPHVQNPDRVAAAEQALADHCLQVLVLDDGFQHRRLHRDLDIVLLDALEPFGYGRLIPRGLLREPPQSLARADVVVLSRADAIAPDEREQIRRQVAELSPQAAWVEARHAPARLLAAGREAAPIDALAGQRVAAFCGLGNPAGFRHTLGQCGLELAGWREFPDHHRYAPADLAALGRWAAGLPGAAALVCTLKDLVKIEQPALGGLPLWALAIDLELLAGREQLEHALRRLVVSNDPAQSWRKRPR